MRSQSDMDPLSPQAGKRTDRRCWRSTALFREKRLLGRRQSFLARESPGSLRLVSFQPSQLSIQAESVVSKELALHIQWRDRAGVAPASFEANVQTTNARSPALSILFSEETALRQRYW